MANEQPSVAPEKVLVLCKLCTAMRSSIVPACFCGETEYTLAPDPKPLFDFPATPKAK